MVLSPQAQRAWKTVTAIVTAGTAFHLVFQVDYGDHDHVFTNLQRWYRKKVDDFLIGDIGRQQQQQITTATINTQDNISNVQKNTPDENNAISATSSTSRGCTS